MLGQELKPCPLCGNKVHWNVCGGLAAFGCGEWEFEVDCQCGLNFNSGPYDCKEDAERNGIDAWNTRHEKTCRIDMNTYEQGGIVKCDACEKRIPTKNRSTYTVEAKYPYCPWCGARLVD